MATTTAGIEGLRATASTLERQVERFRLHAPQPARAAKLAAPIHRALPRTNAAREAPYPMEMSQKLPGRIA